MQLKHGAPFEMGLVVRDLASLLPFYTSVLGFAVASDIEVPAVRSAPTGLARDGYRIVRLDSDAGNRLKLVQPVLSENSTDPYAAASS